MMDQEILDSELFSVKFQICFESAVLVEYVFLLNESLWLLYLVLKVVSQHPMSDFVLFSIFTTDS